MALSATWTLTDITPRSASGKVVWVAELGLFFALGSTGHIGYSSNGTSWSFSATPREGEWCSVTYSPTLELLVAVAAEASGVNVATSPDGLTWTAAASLSHILTDVVWAPSLGLFVACNRDDPSTTTERFATSPDGTNWTWRIGPDIRFHSICWGPDINTFVAFGSGAGGGVNNIATSSDGITWTTRAFPEAAFCIGDGGPQVVWADDLALFVGLAQPASLDWPTICTSPDGVTWTFRENPDFDEINQGEPESLCWVKRTDKPSFVACLGFLESVDGFAMMTSPDGINWEWVPPDANLANLEAIAYSPALDGILCGGFTQTVWGFPIAYSGVSPNNGNPGGGQGDHDINYQVTITAEEVFGGFDNALGVIFDNNIPDDIVTSGQSPLLPNMWEASQLTVVNNFTLTCRPPNGQGLTDVMVYGFYDGAYRVLAFIPEGFTYHEPAIVSVLPATGNAGDTITVTAENLYDFGNQRRITDSMGPDGFYIGEPNPGHRLTIVFDDLSEVQIPPEDVTVVSETSITGVMPYHNAGTGNIVNVKYQPASLGGRTGSGFDFSYDGNTLVNVFTYTAQQWGISSLGYYGTNSVDPPDEDIEFPWPEWEEATDIYTPPYTIYEWDSVSAPLETGWWHSINEGFAGTGLVIYNGRPKAPRGFGKLSPFATGSAGMMGGFPGPSCVLNNRMIYAENTYTDVPIIRIFNGALDRELVRVPKTAALATPIAVVTMLAANNTVYFTTLDSGTTSANWAGRVFSLDPASATITLLGAAFGSGQVPYALAWHMGRLWVGTNSADPAVTGNVYYIRPGIDTAWTTDEALSAHTVSGVTSMLPFEGKLYVGTSAAAAVRAKVLVRDSLGTYTTSDTGSGGAAAANNCFPALTNFQGSLYNSHWNPDGTPIALIRKMTAGVWATVYTGSGTTLKPFIAFPQDTNVLLAVGGGLTRDVGLARTTDGTTWTNATTFLQQFTPASTGLPAFGVLKR